MKNIIFHPGEAKPKPVCPFACRACNHDCRAYLKQSDDCQVLDYLEEMAIHSGWIK